ncbi:MAG: 5-guanidino-2-oxopentanoate decarboxylase [Actinobacteria bacterium]|nr:5-guanidino-2-oxopentanoate decarboxylase [Actinomycetota bacterium]
MPAGDEMGSCGEAVVRCLEANGVRHVFGIPGTHNLSIYEPLAGSRIRHVTPRHEQGAGYAADAYARVSGRPGVCLTTSGPGLTNVVTAAATSYHDSVPTLVISPGMASSVDGRDTGFLHEVKSQTGTMESVVDWSRRVGTVADAARAVRDAFAAFATGRPRPVHIELPLDLLESDAGTYEAEIAAVAAPAVDEPALAAAAALLAQAESPALLLGGGALAAGPAAQALAERLGALIVTTVRAKGVVDERHPLSLGACLRLPAARRALAEADVVLAVGTELSESDLWVREPEFGGRLIRVDIDPRQLQKNHPAAAAVLGDAEATLGALGRLLGPPPAELAPGALERACGWRAQLEEELAADGGRYAALHLHLGAALGEDGILVGDSAMPVYYGSVHQFVARAPRRFVYPVGYATLGYAIPGAIGAKLARPEARVLGLMGDGGAMFAIAELATAVELRLPIPFVVVENGGYGEIRDEMVARGAKPLGVDLTAPDFVGLAEAMGAAGERVEALDDLPGGLERAFAAGGPSVLVLDEGLLQP